jgi:hypothetical protein
MEGWMKAMENNMKTLAEELKELKTSRQTQNNRWHKNSGKKANASRQEIICYECDKPGHIKRNCPTLKNRSKPKYGRTYNRSNTHQNDKGPRKDPQVSVGLGSSFEECGLYVNVIIQGEKTKVLVDTGATVTLVSTRLYNKLSETVRPNLHTVKQTIMSANGTPLSVRGKSEFNFTIDKKTYHNDAVVTYIKVDGILGLDFLKTNNCTIDMSNDVLSINGKDIRMSIEGSLGCFRVTDVDTVSIPPRSEVIIQEKVCVPDGINLPKVDSIVEPNCKETINKSTLTAREMVHPRETVPVRLMNVSEEAKVLHTGTVVGQLTEIREVQKESLYYDTLASKGLRKDLADLLSKSESELTPEQRQKAKEFLIKYTHLFAENNFDFGRTEIVKHYIKTDDSRPIKQQPRPTPAHLMNKVDKNINYVRHVKRVHPSSRKEENDHPLYSKVTEDTCNDNRVEDTPRSKNTSSKGSEQDHDGSMSEDEEAWLAEDPDITIGEDTETVQVERRSPEANTASTSDPTVRKKTSPMSMYSLAPSKVARSCTIVFDAEQRDPPAQTTKSASVLTESKLVGANTQTEPV